MNNRIFEILNKIAKAELQDPSGEAPPLKTPCDPPSQDPRPVPITPEWTAEQIKCCKCLVYGEAGCNSSQCQKCAAWVMRNRRVKKVERRWASTPCGQAIKTNEFEGGYYSPTHDKFPDCYCDKVTEPGNRRCIEAAERVCNQVGLGTFDDGSTYPHPDDPTGGANYFMACGSEPEWMSCNITKGICKKVGGTCASCGNCYYYCKKQPKTCAELGVTPPKKAKPKK